MGHDTDSRTRISLLLRLRDLSDSDAWNDFVNRYAPKIYLWCRRRQLQEADAADVTQDVLSKLVAAMRKFQYDPTRGSFRGWLKVVTNHAIHDLMHSSGFLANGSENGVASLDRLQAIRSADAMADLAKEIEARATEEILDEAHELVRPRVKDKTWQAYYQTAVEHRAPPDVAQTLDIKVADVYVAKSRVIRMLKTVVQRMDAVRHIAE